MTRSGSPAPPGTHSYLFSLTVIAVALVYASCLFISVENENETNDEPAHIVAGYSYWMKGDFRLNPEHPPLSKLLCAIPLLVLKPDFPNDQVAWNEADEFRLGKELLYGAPDGGHRILLACRSVSILFTTAFAVYLAFWARRKFSSTVALWIFFLFVLDPNIAAHGRYVTSDIFITVFFFLTTVYWYDWLCDRKNVNLWLTSIALGLALASKFSGILLFPVLAAMFVVHRWFARRSSLSESPRLNALKVAGVLILVPTAIVLACYAGDSRSVSTDPLISARLSARGQEPSAWQRIPVPGYYWVRGVQILAKHQAEGHANPAYLLGKLSDTGFIAYFPVAMLVKTPTGTLALFTAALLSFPFRGRRHLGNFSLSVALAIPLLLYFLVSISSRIDIGIRHVILLYPFLYVLTGAWSESMRSRIGRLLICAALLLNLFEIMGVYPNQIAFFNALSGGPNNGAHYLLDSNIDWGQDLIHLRDDLADRQHACLALEYFGRADVTYYLPDARPVPTNTSQAKAQPCLIAASVQMLYGAPDQHLSYLLKYQPIARAGYSIFIYDPSKF